MEVVVLGAGVIGITTAYYLVRDGHAVTVIDRQSAAGLETSFANGSQIAAQFPALAPIINAFPHGQTQINAQVARFTAAGQQLDHENSAMLRLDQHFTENSTS